MNLCKHGVLASVCTICLAIGAESIAQPKPIEDHAVVMRGSNELGSHIDPTQPYRQLIEPQVAAVTTTSPLPPGQFISAGPNDDSYRENVSSFITMPRNTALLDQGVTVPSSGTPLGTTDKSS